jgi:cyclopropane fatty-acyl-phospholipid synthase-like methyltransferase
LSSFSATAGPRLPKVIASFISKPGSKVLDYGAGEGSLCWALANMGYKITAYDRCLSDKIVASHQSNPLLCNKDPSGLFDAIIASEVLEHLLEDEINLCFQRWHAMLPIGGRLIITTPHEENLKTALCLCPACSITFHRWQHQRSISFKWLSNYLSPNKGWRALHSGRYDFSSDVEMITAIKRYNRYKFSIQDKIQSIIDANNNNQQNDIAAKIAKGIEDLIFSGTLNDEGLDHSEGKGNVLVHVVEKTRNLI